MYGKYDLYVLESNERDGKELEYHLTHLSSLLVVEHQSLEISKLVSIVFEGDSKQNEVIIAE